MTKLRYHARAASRDDQLLVLASLVGGAKDRVLSARKELQAASDDQISAEIRYHMTLYAGATHTVYTNWFAENVHEEILSCVCLGVNYVHGRTVNMRRLLGSMAKKGMLVRDLEMKNSEWYSLPNHKAVELTHDEA